ncbi:hypothetical protein PLESTF_000569400 [Pleodorina starrii]|nr:hypothetical protein PLESTF_000569400 [Pleodorina starrii]
MLQRLLPGGALLELLMGLVEERAADLAPGELLVVARMIAAWCPPASCEALAPAAAAVAAALADRSLASEPVIGSGGRDRSSSSGGDAAASAAATDGDVAVLAEALAALRRWLQWRASADGSGGGGGFSGLLPGLPGVEGVDQALAGGVVEEGAGEALEGARAAVMALLRRVGSSSSSDGATAEAASAEPSAMFAVLSAAVQYGVTVPQGLAKTAARMAAAAPPTPPASSSSPALYGDDGRAAQLAAQLVALACGGASGGGSISLTAAEVRDLVVPQLYGTQPASFLTALLAALREGPRMGSVAAPSAAAAAMEGSAGGATAGLLEALGSAAGRLGPVALALAMECTADVAAAAASLAAPGSVGEVGAVAAWQMLAAAAALADQRQSSPPPSSGAEAACTPDELCRLAAAAARLQRSGIVGSDGDGSETALAHAAQVLTAVQAAPLQEISVDAAAALVAAAWRAAGGGEVPGSLGFGGLPGPLLDSLLDRIAVAATPKTAAPARRRSDQQQQPAADAVAAEPSSLSYDQALGVLAAVVAASEAAADAAPSTSDGGGATAAGTVPPDRAAALRAAALVACRAVTPTVGQLDAAGAVRLLHFVARMEHAGVRPNFPQLLWALHERLRALATADSLAPADVLAVLRSCTALRWRPSVLLRDLLLPLLRWMQLSGEAPEPSFSSSSSSSPMAAAAVAAGAAAAAADRAAAGGVGDGRGSGSGSAERAWSARELKDCLALLAKLRFSGPFASAVVKMGLGRLLRDSAAAAGGGGGREAAAEAQLSASELSMLLWVCVSTRYRGAAVLRPLLQQLLQVPPARVPVKAAAQAVWAAARLGVVGERLVRWALASCQGGDKLATAAPQSLACLCWGLAKLGVRPPRAFVMAAAAASRSQLRAFKAAELATLLFVLAGWEGRLRGGGGAADDDGAASVVRHVVATRAEYDGPALCTAVWALQRLTAPPPPDDPAAVTADAGGAEPGGDAAVVAALDAAALRSFEDQLLAVDLPADPRVGFPDHHLLRYFSACAAADYRPERLLRRYASRLLPRLRSVRGVSPADAPAAADRLSRMLWSSSRVLAMFELRNPDLLASLELCAERCQSQLRPGHLAGLLNAMATLGHYPARWAERGLLRRVGLALRSATLTEAGLILEALAAWKPHMSAPGASAAAAKAQEQEAGNGSAAAGEEEEEKEAGEEERQGTHRLRGPTAQRVDVLRRVVLARLTQLCAPPPPPPKQQQQPTLPASAAGGSSAAGPSPAAAAAAEAAAVPVQSAAAAAVPAAQQSAADAASGSGGGAAGAAAASISLDDAMRLLTALAKLRWQCGGQVEAALVRAASRLPLDRRRRLRVPELTTLMWALASLRQDSPELQEDLQAALLGLPPQPSLAAEMSLLESGRVAAVRVAEGNVRPAAAAAATAATASASPPATAAADAAQEQAPAEPPQAGGASRRHEPPPPSGSGSPEGASVATAAAASDTGSSSSSSTERPSEDADDGSGSGTRSVDGGGSGSGDEAAAARRDVQLLSRPAKPASAVDSADEAATAGGTGGGAAAAGHFDPAAAMAAAAAAVTERYEQQLVGPLGRSQLVSEPWAPADVFKVLWACAKMNRHPGPLILAAAERSWLQHTAAGGGDAAATAPPPPPLPLHTITGLLWSLSVFRHHNGSFAQRLAEQLGAWLAEADGDVQGTRPRPPTAAAVLETTGGGGGAGRDGAPAAENDEPSRGPELQHLPQQQERQQQQQQEQQRRQAAFARQAVQVAACLLAAQADRADSPLNTALPPEVRARLVAAWRARLAQRLATPPNRHQADVVSVLRKMGFTAAANVATPDGCALVDVAVALRQTAPSGATAAAAAAAPRLLALELVGPHNTAANSPRILGEAVLKYRLLQARGYLVVPIPCFEWDQINHNDTWTKMVYLQTKIDRRTAGAAAAAAAAGAGARAAGAAPPATAAGGGNGSNGVVAAASSAAPQRAEENFRQETFLRSLGISQVWRF